MESILTAAIGVLCIVLGIFNAKGNLSSLHFYHRHRVSEEDKPRFAKLVGIGTIIVGVSCVVMSVFSFLAEKFQNSDFLAAGSVVLCVGFILGLGISFYAMIKYNKGIF
jgi:hypothetical protein